MGGVFFWVTELFLVLFTILGRVPLRISIAPCLPFIERHDISFHHFLEGKSLLKQHGGRGIKINLIFWGKSLSFSSHFIVQMLYASMFVFSCQVCQERLCLTGLVQRPVERWP